MADDPTVPGAGGTPADPNAPNPTPPAGSGNPPAGDPTSTETISQEEAKKLKQESQSLRRRLRELEDAEKKRTDAELSETERLKKQLAEVEAERESLRTETRRMKAQSALRDAGAIDPELIADRLTDVDLTDAKATEAAIKRLRERHPAQFRAVQGSGDGGAGNGNRSGNTGTTNLNEFIRRRAQGGGAGE